MKQRDDERARLSVKLMALTVAAFFWFSLIVGSWAASLVVEKEPIPGGPVRFILATLLALTLGLLVNCLKRRNQLDKEKKNESHTK